MLIGVRLVVGRIESVIGAVTYLAAFAMDFIYRLDGVQVIW